MSTGDSSNQPQGQLGEFAVLANHVFAVAVSFCYSLISNATRWTLSPFFLVYPAISYLLAPITVSVAMVIDISVLAPLSVARYLLSSLYPVYVFCSIACITGIVAGMGGRGLSALLTRMFARSEQNGSAPTDVPAARGIERRSRRRRLRIKEEDT